MYTEESGIKLLYCMYCSQTMESAYRPSLAINNIAQQTVAPHDGHESGILDPNKIIVIGNLLQGRISL